MRLIFRELNMNSFPFLKRVMLSIFPTQCWLILINIVKQAFLTIDKNPNLVKDLKLTILQKSVVGNGKSYIFSC